MSNRVLEENARTDGVAERSYWDVPHSTAIEGFATDISINAGGTVDFKINVNDGAGSDYKVEIFRLGYYGGNGAREVTEWTNENAIVQPDALQDRPRGLVDAGNWAVTDSWDIPSDAVSGVYLARIQRLDADGNTIADEANQIPFIVRNDGVPADIVLQTSDTTWQAYNGWGGNNGAAGANFYGDRGDVADARLDLENAGSFAQDRAYAVSYNRPFITRDGSTNSPAAGAQDYLFGADYAAIHWLEQNGYDVTYISGIDTDRLGTSWFENDAGDIIRKAYISVGHDEYWSGDQRINVEDARDSGVNLLFWSGNEVYWKTRWDKSIADDGTEYRTLVSYKETWANGDPNAGPDDYNNIDPTDIWTGTWRDIRFNENPLANDETDPTAGARAENSLTGQLFGPDGTGDRASIDVPAQYGDLRVWRDTAIANAGDDLDISNGILGYEWNVVPEDELRPAGLIKLSSSIRDWSGILVDQGNSTEPGTAEHNLSLYRAESGALVFGAGTVFWSWGLSDEHDSSPYGGDIENTAIKQFTVNMFADMGIQPGVADAILGSQQLVRASASTDVTPATATIDAALPTETSALASLIITGTASDIDGQVAQVEVSLDGGVTWKVAQTTDAWSTWSYVWLPKAQGEYDVQARAIDDSLNVFNATPDAATVTVTAPILPDTFSVFDPAQPVTASLADDPEVASLGGLELGMKFEVEAAGAVTELKYWRAPADADDIDVRDGHLWGPDGTLLATVRFTAQPGASGWQVAELSAPVAVMPGQTYTVSYRTADNYVSSNGFFGPANEVAFDGRDDDAFSDPFGVISAPQDEAGDGNGVFVYGSSLVLPANTFMASNYWVDVTFDPTEAGDNLPPAITSPASFSVAENLVSVGQVTADDPEGFALAYSIDGIDAARFTINATTGALAFRAAPNFEAPTDAGADNVYNMTVNVSDGINPAVSQAIDVTVTDVIETPSTGSSIFEGEAPENFVANDPTDYELGTKFTSSQFGFVTELQYFRGLPDAGDIDTRVLNLWNAGTGENLGSVSVVSGVGATGWQVGTLASPVSIAAGSTYIVSYGYDQDGTNDAYAFSGSFFATDPNSSPDGILTAPVSGVLNGSGGAGNGLLSFTLGLMPDDTFNAANYWVDVVFSAEAGSNDAPVITTTDTFDFVEGATGSVFTAMASDADGDDVTFSIAGGDADTFEIDPESGTVTFAATPDFVEGGDNTFEFTLSASDGAASVQQAVTVTLLRDSDGDLVADNADNATFVFNPDQRDSDGDGYGNVVDGDLNNDGFVGTADLAIFRTAYRTAVPTVISDTDPGDDADFDGNGFVGNTDLAMFRTFFGGAPGPSYVDELA